MAARVAYEDSTMAIDKAKLAFTIYCIKCLGQPYSQVRNHFNRLNFAIAGRIGLGFISQLIESKNVFVRASGKMATFGKAAYFLTALLPTDKAV